MDLTDTFGVLENYESEGFHNIIVNILDVILEAALMFLPNDLPLFEPNIFLKVNAPICERLQNNLCINTIYIHPSLELRHGYILHIAKRSLISRNTLRDFLEFRQDCLVSIQHRSPK